MATDTGAAPIPEIPDDAVIDDGWAWAGWVAFAAIAIFVVGCLNMIMGLAALLKDDVYLVPKDGLLVTADWTAWGWALIAWGALLAMTALGLGLGWGWARWIALVLVATNVITQFAFFPAYPLWSIVVIGAGLAVIFTLTARWPEAKARLGA